MFHTFGGRTVGCRRYLPFCNSYEPPWTTTELLSAFNNVIQQDRLPVKMCFFVDGLNQYDEKSDDLVYILKCLASSPRFKLCLSSRFSSILHGIFSESADQQLILEEMTRGDIALYVKNKLESDRRYVEPKEIEPRILDLHERIIKRANGFFLWVTFVVRSLLQDPVPVEGDLPAFISAKLNYLPAELMAYFERLLGIVDPDYRQETAQVLPVNLFAVAPLPLATVSHLIAEGPGLGRNQENHSTEIDFLAAQKTVRNRLSTRCQNMLEVTVDLGVDLSFRYNVAFLHPTVRKKHEPNTYLMASASYCDVPWWLLLSVPILWGESLYILYERSKSGRTLAKVCIIKSMRCTYNLTASFKFVRFSCAISARSQN